MVSEYTRNILDIAYDGNYRILKSAIVILGRELREFLLDLNCKPIGAKEGYLAITEYDSPEGLIIAGFKELDVIGQTVYTTKLETAYKSVVDYFNSNGELIRTKRHYHGIMNRITLNASENDADNCNMTVFLELDTDKHHINVIKEADRKADWSENAIASRHERHAMQLHFLKNAIEWFSIVKHII